MKKIAKLALLLCIVLTSLSFLCSCDLVDELREQRIEFVDGEDGYDYSRLEYKGVIYKKLPDFKKDREIVMDDSIRCHIVDKEVPLLLIQDVGYSARYDKSKDVIRYAGSFYCPLDKYDRYAETLATGNVDFYRSIEYVVDEQKQQVYTKYYVLSERAVSIINDTSRNTVGRQVRKYNYEDWVYLTLDACDRDNLIVEEGKIQLYHDTANNKYGIMITPGDHSYIIKEFIGNGVEDIAEIFRKADFDIAYAKAYGYDIDLENTIVAEEY